VVQLKEIQPEKLGRRYYSGFIRLWQYQLFCMAQNVGHSPKDKKSRLEAAEMRFLRSVAGYRLTDHRRDEDIREEIQIKDINSRIKDYQIKWLQHLERMEQNRIPKLLLN
jgi:hypothetical protein